MFLCRRGKTYPCSRLLPVDEAAWGHPSHWPVFTAKRNQSKGHHRRNRPTQCLNTRWSYVSGFQSNKKPGGIRIIGDIIHQQDGEKKFSDEAEHFAIQLRSGTSYYHSNPHGKRRRPEVTPRQHRRRRYNSWRCKPKPTTYTQGKENKKSA